MIKNMNQIKCLPYDELSKHPVSKRQENGYNSKGYKAMHKLERDNRDISVT